MVDFDKFFATAKELYAIWPSFFNWIGGGICTFVVAVVGATWWLGSYKASKENAELSTKIAGLEGELKVVRVQLESERTSSKAQFEAEKAALKGQLEAEKAGLRSQIDVLSERIKLANEQQAAATKQAEDLKAKLADFERQDHEPVVILPDKAQKAPWRWYGLQHDIDKILTANNAVSTTLSFPDSPFVKG